MTQFVPDKATAPSGFETPDFRVRMLTVNDVVKDYDAVMTSISHLRGVFGPGSTWPSPDLTLEQDLIDLGWHQKEFQLGNAFAYTVMSPDETRCLGCVYVDPSEKAGYDAKVTLWVRQSDAGSLDEVLFAEIKNWLADAWWFSAIAFPGRTIGWREWERLPDHRPTD